MAEPQITTKAELTGAIEAAWLALNGFLKGLSDDQMISLHDQVGWNVKDHLAHLARWEASVAVLFHGRPRHTGLQIDQATYASAEFDAINAAIQSQTKSLPLRVVTAELEENHSDLMGSLRGLSDADLNRRVSAFFPQAPAGDDRRVIDVIFDNTAHHFAEHLAWIEALAKITG